MVALTAEDVVEMYKEKRALEEYLGMIDGSSSFYINSIVLDFINGEFNTMKLGIKGQDVKKAIDRAVTEGKQ
jgi:hypothetical protein